MAPLLAQSLQTSTLPRERRTRVIAASSGAHSDSAVSMRTRGCITCESTMSARLSACDARWKSARHAYSCASSAWTVRRSGEAFLTKLMSGGMPSDRANWDWVVVL